MKYIDKAPKYPSENGKGTAVNSNYEKSTSIPPYNLISIIERLK